MKKFSLLVLFLFLETLRTLSAASESRTDRLRALLASADTNYVFVALHQGDHARFPGNTRESILGAIEMNADIVEIDVRKTRDGRFVLSHDQPKEPAPAGLLTLEEVFAMTRGRILVNIDKFDYAPADILREIDRLNARDQVLLKLVHKSPDEARGIFASDWRHVESGELLYMPVIQFCWGGEKEAEERLPRILADEPRKTSLYEICVSAEKYVPNIARILRAPGRPRVWINTMWDDLASGHGEAPPPSLAGDKPPRALDPEACWGWTLRQGATLIQTDRGRELIAYLDRLGRHAILPGDRPGRRFEAGCGDVILPKAVSAETPAALLIHGGGWSGMSRKDVVGIGEFLADDLGYVVYNTDYRLAGKANPWPACGEDCLKAGEYMFSDEFAAKTGVRPKSILVIGGSAGGHLALWTGLKLGAKCDRIVSISGIADPEVDYPAHPGMYRGLFGQAEVTREMRDTMSVMKLIRPNGPKILLTHATEDAVVPIATAKSFLAAYRRAGNDIGLFEYPSYIQPDLTGHCIWIPGSKPHRLIPRLEREIAYFLKPTPVPAPRPVRTKYEISAHYYAGTEHAAEWDMVRETMPERKPLLGWFDESDPENVDWQIKWAAEHGIAAYCLCWYWNRGVQRLDHWIQAFYRAQHRRHLKWYLMYANHNQPGAHSTEDQIAVSRFWIDNYLKTPEYYTIGGKPVIVYCSADRLDRDFIDEAAAKGEKLAPGEGMRRAMAITDRMAREAGLKGVEWIHLNWRANPFDAAHTDWIRRGGFSAQMPYHFGNVACAICPEACGRRDYPRRFDFNVMCAASVWTAKRMDFTEGLPVWPSLPTGYDDTPRKFQDANKVIGRTPEKFRACCREIKTLCDAKGVRRLIVAPISEWQEGSMVEPNEDYGFAYYDVIRETFCEKPAAGWPENLTPKDVGRPLLEYPPTFRAAKPEWNFTRSQEGWYRNPFGCYKAEWNPKGYLSFRAIGGILGRTEGLNRWLQNVRVKCRPFRAEDYSACRLRMRLTPNPGQSAPKDPKSTMRLYWGTTARPLIGPRNVIDYGAGLVSATVVADGEWHDYALNLDHNVLWAGDVTELWLQATELGQCLVEIDWVRFEKN